MPFQPGNPGGPGRPRGSRNAINQVLDNIAGENVEAAVRKVVDAAGEGDLAAARLVLGRMWTAPRGRTVEFELPEVRTPHDVVAANAAVIKAMAEGMLTPQEGASICSVIEGQRRAIEIVDVEVRVAALEQKMAEEIGKLSGAA